MTAKATQSPHGERIAALEAVVPGMADKLDEVHSMVHAINGKLGTFIDQMAKADERATDLEVRTRKVENRQHWYSGAGALLGVLAGAFGSHIKT